MRYSTAVAGLIRSPPCTWICRPTRRPWTVPMPAASPVSCVEPERTLGRFVRALETTAQAPTGQAERRRPSIHAQLALVRVPTRASVTADHSRGARRVFNSPAHAEAQGPYRTDPDLLGDLAHAVAYYPAMRRKRAMEVRAAPLREHAHRNGYRGGRVEKGRESFHMCNSYWARHERIARVDWLTVNTVQCVPTNHKAPLW